MIHQCCFREETNINFNAIDN